MPLNRANGTALMFKFLSFPLKCFLAVAVLALAMGSWMASDGYGWADPAYPVSRRTVEGQLVEQEEVPEQVRRWCTMVCTDHVEPEHWRFSFQEDAVSLPEGARPVQVEAVLYVGDPSLDFWRAASSGTRARLDEVVNPYGTDAPPLVERFAWAGDTGEATDGR